VQQFDVQIEEDVLLYDPRGEFAAKFCVHEVKGAHVRLYFEIRLRNEDGSYMCTSKPFMWDIEIREPFELDVSQGNQPDNFLTITVTEFRRGRATLDVVSPVDWEVVRAREIPEEA
jgi:hypothetical protein